MGKFDSLSQETLENLIKINKKVCDIKLKKFSFLSEMDKEDVIQESLIKSLHAVEKYDDSKSRLETFLSKVISNCIINYISSFNEGKNKVLNDSVRVEFGKLENCDNYNDVSENFVLDEKMYYSEKTYRMVELNEAISKIDLTEKEKKIFKYFLKGYTNKDISEILGVPKSYITKICKNIKEKVLKGDILKDEII